MASVNDCIEKMAAAGAELPAHRSRPINMLDMVLRPIADAMRAKGHQISHEGVAGVLRASGV